MILKVKNGPSFGVHLTGNHSLVNILCQHHKEIRVFGSPTVTNSFNCKQGNITTVPMNDPELVGKVSKVLNNPTVDLIQVQLTRGSGTGERVSKIINNIWDSVLPQTLVIILTGRHSSERLKILWQRKVLARIRKGAPLTDIESAELKTLERDTNHHHFWLAVKHKEGFVKEDLIAKPNP